MCVKAVAATRNRLPGPLVVWKEKWLREGDTYLYSAGLAHATPTARLTGVNHGCYKSNPRDVRKIKNSLVLTLGRNPTPVLFVCLFVLEGLAISELEIGQ